MRTSEPPHYGHVTHAGGRDAAAAALRPLWAKRSLALAGRSCVKFDRRGRRRGPKGGSFNKFSFPGILIASNTACSTRPLPFRLLKIRSLPHIHVQAGMWSYAQISFMERPPENCQDGTLRGRRWLVYGRFGRHPFLDFPLSHRRQIIPPRLGQLPIFVPTRSAPTRHRLAASASVRPGSDGGEAQGAAAVAYTDAAVYHVQGGGAAFHRRARSLLAKRWERLSMAQVP